jgi:hypothetical protein
MCRNGSGFDASGVPPIAPLVENSVAVQHLLPESSAGNADAVIQARYGRKITDDQKDVARAFSPPKKTDDTASPVAEIHPFKPLPGEVNLVEGVPLQTLFMPPFLPLPGFPSHEEKLFPRVTEHVSVKEAKVGISLPLVLGHLADQGAFPVGHFIMGKREDKIFIEGVPDAEGELVVMVLSKQRVLGEIFQRIVHPMFHFMPNPRPPT